MRENRPYGLEGGGAQTNVSSLPLSTIAQYRLMSHNYSLSKGFLQGRLS